MSMTANFDARNEVLRNDERRSRLVFANGRLRKFRLAPFGRTRPQLTRRLRLLRGQPDRGRQGHDRDEKWTSHRRNKDRSEP